jgi:CheY-like chemotaxis protein
MRSGWAISRNEGARSVGDKRAEAAPTILVINDDEEILTLFEEILREAGYNALLYSSAIRDLAEIERLQPDLIIIDYLIGHEDSGWQLLQKIKMRRATATVPIVVCTAATKLLLETSGYLLSKRRSAWSRCRSRSTSTNSSRRSSAPSRSPRSCRLRTGSSMIEPGTRPLGADCAQMAYVLHCQ